VLYLTLDLRDASYGGAIQIDITFTFMPCCLYVCRCAVQQQKANGFRSARQQSPGRVLCSSRKHNPPTARSGRVEAEPTLYDDASHAAEICLCKSESLSVLWAISGGEPGLAGFIEAQDDGGGGDKWSYKTCNAPITSSQPTD